MYRFWVTRLAVLAAAGLLALGPSTAAWANSTISINPGNVPTTAAAFKPNVCDPNQGGGPFPGQDVWVFVLPGNHAQSGDFVSLTATFGANGPVTITAAANPGNFDNGGPNTAKAWIVTPAGWTLTAATAEITGTGDFFNLTHTCPGSPGPTTPTPGPTTASPTASPSPSATTIGPETPFPVPSDTPDTGPAGPKPSGAPETGGGGGSGTTGGMALGIGALTVAAASGLGLALARRRRRGA